MLILTRKLFEAIIVDGRHLITYMGYCSATTVHTMTIEDTYAKTERAVTLCPGQYTVIIDGVIMKVLDRKSGSSRLGFDAPIDIAIDRLEVHQQKERSAP